MVTADVASTPSTAKAQSADSSPAVLKIAKVGNSIPEVWHTEEPIPDEEDYMLWQSDKKRVICELANIVNSRAYRSRG
eukprot:CAMPEP_0179840798 /NCGR_PEP_ID=MMETSP0982-20121206/2136_1 /TAXON_ID=483367 /ORGANISM="non described non described, Strain CCMP 2436" /LENGTH=77 /DNA_ID=CAMNT_0021724729 /DNA_START=36 /DNA_END=266 /DNA_ORIENTATION=+